jgi:glycosyltransferase involved in cell wall biosynthesis
MKYLYVCENSCNANSGAAGSLIAIGEQLQQLGHVVDYIWETPHQERCIKRNNYYRFLELPFRQYSQIKKTLETKSYDVVSVSQPHAWYAYKKLKAKYPNILFVNRTHGWEKRIAINTNAIESKNLSLKSLLSKKITSQLITHCSYLTAKYADLLVAACSDDAEFIKKDYPEFQKKVVFISYGLENEFLWLKLKNKENNNNKIRFLYSGQYLKRKGIEDLKEVFFALQDRMNDFELCFIVHPSSISLIEKDFRFLKSSLKTMSWMGRKELVEQYISSDIFLMTSYGEGFGKTTIEAMACGLCVIGYKEGALTDIGRDKENALLSEIGDKQGLMENIHFALDNPSIIREMGTNAYLNIQQYTWEKCAKTTCDIIEKYIIKK